MVKCSSIHTNGKPCGNTATNGKLCYDHRKKIAKFVCGARRTRGENICLNPVNNDGDHCYAHVSKSENEVQYICGAQRTKNRGKCKISVNNDNDRCHNHTWKTKNKTCKADNKKCQNKVNEKSKHSNLRSEKSKNKIQIVETPKDENKITYYICGVKKSRGGICKNKVVRGLCYSHRETIIGSTCGFLNTRGRGNCSKPVNNDGDRCHIHTSKLKDKIEYRCGHLKADGKNKCRRIVYEKGKYCGIHTITDKEKEETHQTCSECRMLKPLYEFHHESNRRRRECKDCRNKAKRNLNYTRITEGTKLCHICGDTKDVSSFYADKRDKDGLRASCKNCKNFHEYERLSTFDRFINNLLTGIETHSKKHDPPLDITIAKQTITDLYNKHNGLCAGTGIKMTHIRKYTPDQVEKITREHYYNISVDRIDSRKGYIAENVQLVCAGYNLMKLDMIESEFIQWCRWVSDYILRKSIMENISLPDKNVKLDDGFESFIRKNFKSIVNGAPKRRQGKGIKVEINVEHIFEMYKKNEGTCSLSDQKLTAIKTSRCRERQSVKVKVRRKNRTNISVDRIDSLGDYTSDNIQLVCCVVNFMKGTMPQDLFIEFCIAVDKFNAKTSV